MAYKNGAKYQETTATRRKAAHERDTWLHISMMPYMKKGQGVTLKKQKTIEEVARGKAVV